MNHTYKVALWNANGLSQHFREVESFVSLNKIDILLISETHFTERSYFRLPGFTTYDTKHPDGRAHAGTAVLLRRNIKHHAIPPFETAHIQATSVCIEDWNGPLVLSAIYCPPRHNINKDQFEAFFRTLGNRFIAGGDYNAKHRSWGSRLNTPRGRELHKSIRLNNLEAISTGEPTYWPSDHNRVPDLLDILVTKGISQNYVRVESSTDLSSDHTPVICTISSGVFFFDKPFKLINQNTNWCNFKSMLDRDLQMNVPLRTPKEIEEAVQYFTRTVQKCAWQSTPVERLTTKYPDYPAVIRRKIEEKRRLRRLWQYSRHPLDKRAFNEAARTLKTLICEFKNETFHVYLQNLSPFEDTNYSLWKVTKRLKQPCLSIPPLRRTDGSWARSDEEKARLFADELERRFTPHDRLGNAADEEIMEQFLTEPHLGDFPPPILLTPGNVKEVIDSLHPSKAPGFDFITGKVLQELPRKGIVFLTFIFNAALRTGHFPELWKAGKITMIPKPGKPPFDVSSYRPICLLPVASKLFEKLLLKILQHYLDNQNVIPNHQFGFRQRHSTIEQVHRLVKEIRNCLEKKLYCSAAFLDVEQAFDRVWHTGLLYKLKEILPYHLFEILKSYLTERKFQVKVRDYITNLRPAKAGVPQGSVLGPVLYSIFTSDLPTNDDTLTATFADDTAILSCDEDPNVASDKLQQNLIQIENWLKKWRIRVNERKSTHLTFTMRKNTCPTVKLNNIPLPQSDDVKYLGLHLDRRLTWTKHIRMKRKQLTLKFNNLYWLLGRKSKLTTENKLLIYKAILKPIWCYGIQLWGTASNSNIEILQRFQSKTLRSILGVPWYVTNNMIHRDCGIKTVKEVVTECSAKYLSKLNDHSNYLAVNLLDNSEELRRLKRSNTLDLPDRFTT